MLSATNTRQLNVSEKLSDEFEERSFDTDIVLPDYCPDIAVILKCVVTPRITAHFRSGDRYTVDGITSIRVLYLTEDRDDVYAYETSQPFTVAFRCVDAVHHHVFTKTDYVNCRATGPRRMDVHGAIRVFLKTMGIKEVAVFNAPDSPDTHCLSKKVEMTLPICEVNKPFYVNDTIDLGVKSDRHIYTDVAVGNVEQKKLTNKLILKGMLLLKEIYKNHQNTACLQQEIPFSQIIDIENLTEDWNVNVDVSVCEIESYMQETENGGSGMTVNCKLMAHICCSKCVSTDVALDVYSTDCPVICETEAMTFIKNGERLTYKHTIEDATELPQDVVDVIDVWGELKEHRMEENENGRQLSCCFLLGIIGKDATGHLGYYERTIDHRMLCNSDEYPTNVKILSMEHTVADNRLCFKMRVERMTDTTTVQTQSVVTRVIEETAKSYENKGTVVRLVYPEAGELVWDIAKKHHSSVEKIKLENDIDGDRIKEASMLIVPIS